MTVASCVALLRAALDRFRCSAPVYCFMPDHLHVIVEGGAECADTRGAMAAFKQHSGFWFHRHRPNCTWQKDFWDHVIRNGEDLAEHVRYIVENPVRKGLCQGWREYPYTGAIGHNLAELLLDIAFSVP